MAHDDDQTTKTKVEHVSWDLLFDQMAAAKKAHEEKSGLASKAALGADMLSDYINLIPDEFGLGILKGGLSLIFGVRAIYLEASSGRFGTDSC